MIDSQREASRPVLSPVEGVKGVPMSMIDAVRLIRRSGLFDETFYITHYATHDPTIRLVDPISHYLAIGFEKGFLPSARFERDFYLDLVSDDSARLFNPLLFLVFHGHGGALSFCSSKPTLAKQGRPPYRNAFRDLNMNTFRELARRRKPQDVPVVDVIMPVYAGYRESLEAIYAVLASRNKTEFELIVINDCVPDNRLASTLEKLATFGLFSLVQNNENLGFVKSVNSRLNCNRSRDVILLNNDTIVYGDWIDRIRAHTRPDVATITPFSNNATLCSYPIIFEDNDIPQGVNGRQLDTIASRCNRGKAVELPTGVGFCFFMSRAAIEKVGVFDARTFGMGYGEENDFCLRASAKGFVNLQAMDVFVYHKGGASFGNGADARKTKNLVKLTRKHPTYGEKIRDFAIKDPSRAARQAMDFARLSRRHTDIVLCFSHRLGGGIERYLQRRVSTQGRKDTLIVARPNWRSDSLDIEPLGQKLDCPNLRGVHFIGEKSELACILASSQVDHLEIHSLFGYPWQFVQQIPGISKRLGLAYDFYVHDYQAICPRLTLVDDSDRYCGEHGPVQCRVCLAKRKQELPRVHWDVFDGGLPNIHTWRSMYGALLAGARRVICPSKDTKSRIRKYFPRLSLTVVPHESSTLPRSVGSARRSGYNFKIRIGILGGLSIAKGALVIAECAKAALLSNLQVEFVLIGHSELLEGLKLPNVVITGRYDDQNVLGLISGNRIDCLFLPSVAPETYLYTLDHCFEARLPLFVFDLGAQGERIRRFSLGHRIPLDLAEDPEGLLRFIMRKLKIRP